MGGNRGRRASASASAVPGPGRGQGFPTRARSVSSCNLLHRAATCGGLGGGGAVVQYVRVQYYCTADWLDASGGLGTGERASECERDARAAVPPVYLSRTHTNSIRLHLTRTFPSPPLISHGE